MQLTYRIATLNMNGISSPLKMYMLRNSLIRQDINVALIHITTFPKYTVMKHLNEGTEKMRDRTYNKIRSNIH